MKNINNHILLLYHVALSESLKNLVFHYKVIISDFDLENFCLVLTPNVGPTSANYVSRNAIKSFLFHVQIS